MREYARRIDARSEDFDSVIRGLRRVYRGTRSSDDFMRLDAALNRLPHEEQDAYRRAFWCEDQGCNVEPTGWTIKWDSSAWVVGTCNYCGREVTRYKATERDLELAPIAKRAYWLPEAVECGDVESIFEPSDVMPIGRRSRR